MPHIWASDKMLSSQRPLFQLKHNSSHSSVSENADIFQMYEKKGKKKKKSKFEHLMEMRNEWFDKVAICSQVV